MSELDGVPDWYLVAALRGVSTFVAQRRALLDRPTDEEILRYWHALMATAPSDHEDESVAR